MKNSPEQIESPISSATNTREKIDSLNELAWNLRDSNEARALELAQEAYQLAQAEQYQKGIAYSLAYQSMYETLRDSALGFSRATEAMTIFEQMGDFAGQSLALHVLGGINFFQSNYSEAVALASRAYKLVQEIGNLALEVEILNLLGLAYIRSDHPDLGFPLLERALTMCRSRGEQMNAAKVLLNIAWLYVEDEKFDRALEYARESVSLCGEPRPSIYGYALLALGKAYSGVQAEERALLYYQEALSLANAQGDKNLSKMALFSIGELFVATQKPDRALPFLNQALALSQETKNNLYTFRCYQALSRAYENLGDFERALQHYKQFHDAKAKVFNEKSTKQIQVLRVTHQTELARREAEIYQLRNAELEREIVERKRLEEKLLHLSVTDELTGIANRRHFLELGERHLKHAIRFRHALSLAVIDLDHFKQINDMYGHAIGDRALVSFVKTIRANIREMDVFARFGGDEFVLMCLESDSLPVYQVLERIRRDLVRSEIAANDKAFSLTLSAGISALSSQSDTLDTLLERADKALHRAKQAGRNRIEIEDQTPKQGIGPSA